MKQRLYRAWRKSVIVKLLDRNIGYKALLSGLQALWAKKGVVSLIDIGHGYYVVKLSNRDDYINALDGGPWMIYDHYLSVRPWEPNFSTATAKIDKVAVWVLQRIRRPRKEKETKEGPPKNDSKGSRFEVLAEVEDIRGTEATNIEVQGFVVQRDDARQFVLRIAPVRPLKRATKGRPSQGKEALTVRGDQSDSQDGKSLDTRKKAEKRNREKKNGELKMLVCHNSNLREVNEKVGDENMEGTESFSREVQPRISDGTTNPQQDLLGLDPGEAHVTQEAPLKPGNGPGINEDPGAIREEGDMNTGVGPNICEPTESSQEGVHMDLSLVPETQPLQ
ncbi:hypothetical protein K1719_012522 [Acacia pycnantha]|nr:hypothetical protein K1719_012522 [Acacia pycnantha]